MSTTPLLLQYIQVIAPLGSFIATAISVVVVLHVNYTSRISDNSWKVYELYNSEDIKQARSTTRTLMQDLDNWRRTVTDSSSYRTYFQLDTPAGQGQEKKQQELDVHNLLAFYHQVGLLLEQKLLREDFTMLLLGGGLDDRWPILERIPYYYPAPYPYQGMEKLHERYCSWKKCHPSGKAPSSLSWVPAFLTLGKERWSQRSRQEGV